MKKFTAIDLFCGCGGLTEELKQAGFNVKLAVDNAKKTLDSYRLNHPEVSIVHDDIRKLSGKQIAKEIKLNNKTTES